MTYTQPEQLAALPWGTLIAPAEGSLINTAFVTVDGWWTLGSATTCSVEALLDIATAWVQVTRPGRGNRTKRPAASHAKDHQEGA